MGQLASPLERARPGLLFLAFLLMGLAAAVAGASLVVAGLPRIAGLPVAAAGAALVAAGLLARGAGGPRPLVLHAVGDRLADAAMLAAVAWAAMPDRPREAAAAIVALGASYLPTYVRSRAVSLGFRLPQSLAFRGVSPLLVGAALLAGVVEVGLWTVTAASIGLLGLQVSLLARQGQPR